MCVTVEQLPSKMGDVFVRHLFVQVPLQKLREAARAEPSRTLPDLPEQEASHPVSRQPAKTGGSRKRLPFSLCTRLEVTPPSQSPCLDRYHWGGPESQIVDLSERKKRSLEKRGERSCKLRLTTAIFRDPLKLK